MIKENYILQQFDLLRPHKTSFAYLSCFINTSSAPTRLINFTCGHQKHRHIMNYYMRLLTLMKNKSGRTSRVPKSITASTKYRGTTIQEGPCARPTELQRSVLAASQAPMPSQWPRASLRLRAGTTARCSPAKPQTHPEMAKPLLQTKPEATP